MTKFPGRSRIKTLLRNHPGILIVSAVFLIAGILSLNQVLVYTPDSARYLAWAKSLAHLEGYRDLTSPMPLKYVVHAPLYSVLLAPVAAILPYSVPAAKLMTVLFGVATLAAFYWWLRQGFGPGWGVVGSLLLAINPAFVLYSTQVLSDVPFILSVVLLFIFVEKAVQAPEPPWRLNSGFIAVGVCCVFLREVGIAVVVATVVYLLMMKRPKLAIQLIAASIVFYLLWYVRNEVVVASIEHPSMRNTQVFVKHMFTPASAGLFDEFAARVGNNSIVYGLAVIRLPFMADIVLRNISTYSPLQFPVSLALKILPLVYKPFVVVTCVTIMIGMVAEFRRRRRFSFLIFVLACYSVPILLYPINDTRFLMPVLIILFYFLIAGAKWIGDFLTSVRLSPGLLKPACAICLFVLITPNLGWTITYISNSVQCGQAPMAFYERMSALPSYPELFARPLQLAGEWIAHKANPSDVVMCRWKELAIWTNGRPVLDTDPQATLDQFDGLVRDYRIHFIVTVYSRGGMREYESQFARSRKFSFVTVQRIANIEVVQVLRKGEWNSSLAAGNDSTEFAGRLPFEEALRLIQDDRPIEAETLLTNLPDQFRRQVPVQMNIAIAKEFEGQLDSVEAILARFRSLQQAGSAVQQAWYHEEIVAKIREADGMPRGTGKAEILHRVALDYWNLGYRRQSVRFLDSAIAEDNAFFPALVFKAVCAMQQGDTSSARSALNEARRLEPTNVLVTGLEKILAIRSSLGRTLEPQVKNHLTYEIASELRTIGLREEAIDELLGILNRTPDDLRSLRLLVDVYAEKERYEPARFYLKKLVNLTPDNPTTQEELRELERRW